MSEVDLNKITRFEVIDHRPDASGRVVVEYGVALTLSIQDEGRTLKIFMRGRNDGNLLSEAEE